MDPAEHLPVELVRRIIELAAAATTDDRRWRRLAKLNTLFRSLALVNHAWEEASRPYLYAEITLKEEPQANSLVQTVDHHPDRAALVKKLDISYDPFGEDEGWRKSIVLYVLSRCVNLSELRHCGEGDWSSTWDAVLAKSSLHTLKLRWITFTGLSTTFPSLRALSLTVVTLPQDIKSFSKSFPGLIEFSITFGADVLFESEAREPSNLHFVVAMAPQLVTLRLENGTAGIPLSLLQHLIIIGIHLQRIDSTIISDYKLPPPPLPPRFDPAELPSLELRFILHSWISEHMLLTDPLPPQQRLLALFESRDAGVVEAISALRRVKRVVLEPWLVERFPEGINHAVEKLKEKELELEFDSLDSFYVNE
ncbi:hypothetical protein BCR35DRAFT_330097 [Leucosporidium creatinivorum]|uniref:F-box domain-containing protein n=1 Tax=Leucosporidium creatinivorum TaxID=106004 RepID=A0A1Y2FW30_9BASI|nr:hypothetical protein BCR35DRAFT_330097 [Leucosporidium creatinivorum]